MKKLLVRLIRAPSDSIDVGQLAEVERRIYFEYSPEFLATKLQLSPFKLPLRAGLIEHTDLAFGQLPGLFDDSLPDGWGLLLMDRHFRRKGIDPQTLSVLDRLAYLGTRTMGALTYHPPAEQAGEASPIELSAIAKNAEEVLAGSATDVLPQLERAGGSPAGARPKVLVGVKGYKIVAAEGDLPEGFDPWMIKFSAKADARDAGPVEYAYSLMARAAGIDMPTTRLFQAGRTRRCFGVQRFDRLLGNHRVHIHTLANLVHANFRIPSMDYADLLKITSALTRNQADVLEAFRRMVFNVVAHNRDDHAKNFAFIMDDSGHWQLSPAYDLSFTEGPGGEHTMTVSGEGARPTRKHCLSVGERSDLKVQDMKNAIDQVNKACASWAKFAKRADCTTRMIRTVEKTIQLLL